MTTDRAAKETKHEKQHQSEPPVSEEAFQEQAPPTINLARMGQADILRLQRVVGNHAVRHMINMPGVVVHRQPAVRERERQEIAENTAETEFETNTQTPTRTMSEGAPPPPGENGTNGQNPPPDNPHAATQVQPGKARVETPKPDQIAPTGTNPAAEAIGKATPSEEKSKLAVQPPKPSAENTAEVHPVLAQLEAAAGADNEVPVQAPEMVAALSESTATLEEARTVTVEGSGVIAESTTAVGQILASPLEFAPITPESLLEMGIQDSAQEQDQIAQMQTERQQANIVAGQFFADASTRVQNILQIGADIPGRLQGAIDNTKAQITAAVAQQQQAITAHIAQARESLNAQAATAHGLIDQEYLNTIEAARASAASARQQIEAEYQSALALLTQQETQQIGRVEQQYTQADTQYRQAGVTVGDEAVQLGEGRAQQFLSEKINERDSLMDGYLTDRRCEARAKAAREVAKQYRQGLIDAAVEQAQNAMAGKSRDLESVRTVVNSSRETLTSQYTSTLQALDAQTEQSIAEAGNTKNQLLRTVTSTVTSTLRALRQQERTQHQALTDAAQLHTTMAEQSAHQIIGNLQDNIQQAATGFNDQLGMMGSAMAGAFAPDPILLSEELGSAMVELDAGVASTQAQSEQALSTAQENLTAGGQQSIQAVLNLGQQGIEEANGTIGALTTTLESLMQNAAQTFGQFQEQSNKAIDRLTQSSVNGFKAVVTGIQTTFRQMEQNLQASFTQAVPQLMDGLRGAFTKMNGVIDEEAKKAADQEQPAWKGILKVLLVIAVVVVVALVAGPFVIGAVGAFAGALGASTAAAGVIGAVVGGAIVGAAAGATIQIGNNLIDGRTWHEGVGQAMLVGAIGGALGGAGGALGQFLSNAGKLGGPVMQAVGRFGIDAAFDMTGTIIGNLATGQPITLEGLALGFASAAGASLAMGSLGKMGRFGKGIEGIQARSMAAGQRFGNAMGTRFAGMIGIPPRVDVGGAGVRVGDIDVDDPNAAAPGSRPVTDGESDLPPGVKSDGESVNPQRQTHFDQPEVEEGVVVKQRTLDGEHDLKVLSNGRLARCSDCTTLDMYYREVIDADKTGNLRQRLSDIEAETNPVLKAQQAAQLEKELADIMKRPDWLQQIQRGNTFNETRRPLFEGPGKANELYIEKPDGNGYYRLDSYDSIKGEIVSRKYTQLANIQEGTALNYIMELKTKYPTGASIADVPSTPSDLVGKTLGGTMILEVPVQIKPIPRSILDAAAAEGIVIRDINGLRYQ